jgi:ABC-2 type transport system permease protein
VTATVAATRRVVGIGRAFLTMGLLATLGYPMSFIMNQLMLMSPMFVFVFLNRIVGNVGATVGFDYFTFYAIGLLVFVSLNGAIRGLSLELEDTIQQGRLEMLLMEPLRWQTIPIGLSLWPCSVALAMTAFTAVISVALGANYAVSGAALAVVLLLLGTAVGIGIGLLSASLRLLAKKSDPLFAIYGMTSAIIAGQTVPINVLPAPLRAFSWLLPNTYVASGIRKALMHHASGVYGPSPRGAALALVGMIAVIYPLAFWLLGRSMEFGRRFGVLAGY